MSDGTIREDALYQSNLMGRWSFAHQTLLGPLAPTGSGFGAGFVALFTLQGLAAEYSGRWTVHLNHFKYSGGAGLNPNVAADNQVNSASSFRVRVDFGVDGAEESVFIDWPAQGATFQLHAGSFRIALTQPPGFTNVAPLPLLTGFVAPAGASDRTPLMMPCLTESATPIGPLAQTSYPRPPRAVAYRPWFVDSGGGGPVVLEESTNLVGTIVKDDGAHLTAGGPNVFYELGNQAGYIPLHPLCQFVNVVNTSAINPVTVSPNWLLDVG